MTAAKTFPLRYRIIYHGVRFYQRLAMRKYGFTTDKVPKMDEPYLMISNHTTEFDMWLTGLASPKPVYYVCGEHLTRKKVYGKPLRLLGNPIPVPKGGANFQAIREIMKRLKDGYNVMMFPEGKRSYHGETIPQGVALGKLIKHSGCALVTYRIRGGYFAMPRWSRVKRKGHVEGKVMGVYSSEELAKMSAQEITDIINRDTYENAYATQREKHWLYKADNKAVGMDMYLFECPRCKTFDSMLAEGNSFRCTKCGLSGEFGEDGFLHGEDLPFDNVLDWGRWIEKDFNRYVEEKGADLKFVEKNATLYTMLEDYTNKDIVSGDVTITWDEIRIGDYVFPFDKIDSLSVLFGDTVLFTYDKVYYGIKGERFHAWKCGRIWHLHKGDTNDPEKEI